MATSNDLFLSILALDAYNRGNSDQGMSIPGSQTQLGTANILSVLRFIRRRIRAKWRPAPA